MKNKFGIVYNSPVCVCMEMCVCLFPFICKWRLAAHELHIFFRGSEYFKILMTINVFFNLRIHLQNGVKNTDMDDLSCWDQERAVGRELVHVTCVGL